MTVILALQPCCIVTVSTLSYLWDVIVRAAGGQALARYAAGSMNSKEIRKARLQRHRESFMSIHYREAMVHGMRGLLRQLQTAGRLPVVHLSLVAVVQSIQQLLKYPPRNVFLHVQRARSR